MFRNGFILACGLLGLALCSSARAADLHVPASFPTIATALERAASGDQIVLASGTYNEHGLDLVAGVTLMGDPTSPESVVIDAGGLGRVLRAESLTSLAVVSGVTLTGGHAQGSTSYAGSGGGILVSYCEVRLENTRIVGNTAANSGGGMRVVHGMAVMIHCELRGNVAGKGGGGLDASYGATANLLKSQFIDNTAAWGGGASVRAGSRAAIFECRFELNRAAGAPGLGGAVACDQNAELVLKRCVLARNRAVAGGGVYSATGASAYIRNVTIDRNQTYRSGGGLYCKNSTTELDHSIISFHDHAAVSLVDGAQSVLVASNLFGNSGGDWTGDLARQLGNDGNICDDPLYCSPDDLSLQAASVCAPEVSGVGLIGALGVGCDSTVDVPDSPAAVELHAQPNPFNPRTEIVYMLPSAGQARVSVYDLRGRRLSVLVDESRPAGEHRVAWEARDGAGRMLASGTYLMVLETDGQRKTSKLMLVR